MDSSAELKKTKHNILQQTNKMLIQQARRPIYLIWGPRFNIVMVKNII